jgi:hypothetical protein
VVHTGPVYNLLSTLDSGFHPKRAVAIGQDLLGFGGRRFLHFVHFLQGGFGRASHKLEIPIGADWSFCGMSMMICFPPHCCLAWPFLLKEPQGVPIGKSGTNSSAQASHYCECPTLETAYEGRGRIPVGAQSRFCPAAAAAKEPR